MIRQLHPPTIARAIAAFALLWCSPAWAADGDDEGGGEDSPLLSPPEAVRDLCGGGDCEGGQQASFDARSRRHTVRLARTTAKAGDTVRSVAYRYFCSPSLLAWVNQIPFASGADPALPANAEIKVPIAHGSLSGFTSGEQLTPGPGVQMTGRYTDRKWGRIRVVGLLRQAFAEVARRWPRRHPALVGSLSRAGGGRMGHHKSHRSGQDVDVGYYTHAAAIKDWGVPRLDAIDCERTWFLIDHLERTGHVAAIFISPAIQRRLHAFAASRGVSETRLRTLFQYGPKGGKGDALIRQSPGHRDHMHIRLWVPDDMGDVKAQLGV